MGVLLAFASLAYGRTPATDCLGVACLILAFWTKQQGALMAGSVLLFRLAYPSGTRTRVLPALIFILGGPVAYLCAAWFDRPWLLFYTWSLPRSWDAQLLFTFRRTSFVVATFVPFGLLLTLEYASGVWRARSLDRCAPLFLVAASFVTAAYTMMSAGASNNHYMAFIAALAVTSALGVASVWVHGPSRFLMASTAALCAFATGVSMVAARGGYGARADTNAPWALAAALAILLATRRFRDSEARHAVVAALLLLGQLFVSAYDPRRYLPDRDFAESVVRFQAMLADLDGPVVWADRGYAPVPLTGRRLVPAPSWVALQDIERQASSPARAAEQIALFRSSLRRARIDYVLTESPLARNSPWRLDGDGYILVKDFQREFAAIRQIGYHWYSGGEFPRYLYRHVPR